MSETYNQEFDKTFRNLFHQWAVLETSLMMYFSRLILTDQIRAQIIWDSLPNFSSRQKLIRNLVKAYVTEPEQKDVRARLNQVDEIAKTRNLLAHSISWVSSANNELVEFHKVGPKFTKKTVDFLKFESRTFAELETLLKDIEALSFFFGARGNPTTTLSELSIQYETSWHRAIADPQGGDPEG